VFGRVIFGLIQLCSVMVVQFRFDLLVYTCRRQSQISVYVKSYHSSWSGTSTLASVQISLYIFTFNRHLNLLSILKHISYKDFRFLGIRMSKLSQVSLRLG
jgi:hypothetical protein